MSADLLALLEKTRPDLSPAERAALIDATPDRVLGQPDPKPPRRTGSRPRTSASLERRRALVAAGWMPPPLASRFTPGETAALAIIAQEVGKRGACTLFVEQIAALAGVTRSTVKRALRQAQSLHLIRIEERRRTAWRNDANVVTITDAGWLTWLAMRSKGGGVQSRTTTRTRIHPASESHGPKRGFRQAEAVGGTAAPIWDPGLNRRVRSEHSR